MRSIITSETRLARGATALMPDARDVEFATRSSARVAPLANLNCDLTITVETDGATANQVHLPISVIRLLPAALSEVARRQAGSLIPLYAELSTQEAAEFLRSQGS